MENKKKNVQLLGYLTLLCICIVFIIGILTLNNFSDGYYREWLIMIITLIGSLAGGILTMSGVILTLNRTYDMNNKNTEDNILKEKKRQQDQITKIKLLLFNEITTLLSFYESKSLFYLNQKIRCSEFINMVGKEEPVTQCNSYKLDSKFKDYVYKLLMLESSMKNDSVKRILDFYNSYIYFENLLVIEKKKHDKLNKDLGFHENSEFWISFLICREYLSKDLNTITDEINNILDKYYGEDRYRKKKTDYEINKINTIVNEFNNGKLHLDSRVLEILNYLEELQ